MWWSWILAAVGIFGLWLSGRKDYRGWFVGLAAQVLWMAYATVTHQWGFYVSAVAYGFVYLHNGLTWYREHKESVFPDGSDSGRRECMITTEWTGSYIGRKHCATHGTTWEDPGGCPGLDEGDREWWDHSNVSVARSEMSVVWDSNRLHYTLAVDIEDPTQDQADAVHALVYKPFGGGKP